jgi:hypothetical protein
VGEEFRRSHVQVSAQSHRGGRNPRSGSSWGHRSAFPWLKSVRLALISGQNMSAASPTKVNRPMSSAYPETSTAPNPSLASKRGDNEQDAEDSRYEVGSVCPEADQQQMETEEVQAGVPDCVVGVDRAEGLVRVAQA